MPARTRARPPDPPTSRASPAVSTDALVPALHALGVDGERIKALIQKELDTLKAIARRADKPIRRSNIDRELFRTRTNEIRERVVAAHGRLESDAPDWLGGLVFSYDAGVVDLEAAIVDYDNAVPGQTRYSGVAKGDSRDAVDLLAPVRKYAGERIPNTDEFADLRSALSVGAALRPEAPRDNLKYLNTVVKACEEPLSAAIIEEAGLFPKRIAKRAKAMAVKLKKSIHDGVGGEVRRAEAAEAMNLALLQIEITLSRRRGVDDRVRGAGCGRGDGGACSSRARDGCREEGGRAGRAGAGAGLRAGWGLGGRWDGPGGGGSGCGCDAGRDAAGGAGGVGGFGAAGEDGGRAGVGTGEVRERGRCRGAPALLVCAVGGPGGRVRAPG